MLLGDKDKATKSTSPLVSYNSTHVTDIVEPGGGPGGSDRLFEAKVVSPCTLAERQRRRALWAEAVEAGLPVWLRQHGGVVPHRDLR